MNNYEILGLSKGASISEVKSKFRQLSKKYHPDMPGGDAAKFISIRKAYEALLKGESGEPQQSYSWDSQNARQRGQDHDENFWRAWQQQAQQDASRYQWERQQAYQQQRTRRRNPAQYRFDGIGKDTNGYIFRIFVDGVSTIAIFGRSGKQVGYYTVRGRYGIMHLEVKWEDAKKADYQFEITLNDDDGYSATMTYKIKRPLKWWQKLLQLLKIRNY